MNYVYIFTKEIDDFNTKAVFLSDKQEKRFVKKREELESEGYELLIDNANSIEAAYEMAIREQVFPDYCLNCGSYVELYLYRGKKYDSNYYKFVIFNGHLCESCGTDSEDIVVKKVSNYKPKFY